MTNEEEVQMQLEKDRAWHRKMQEESYARQQPSEEPKPMGWLLFLPALFISVIADAIDALTAGTIGWLIGLFVDFVLLLMLGISSAGRKQWKKWIVGLAGESIPIIASLPLRTGFLIWAFISSRSQTLQKVSNIAAKFTPKK